jgi:hypothetical protein
VKRLLWPLTVRTGREFGHVGLWWASFAIPSQSWRVSGLDSKREALDELRSLVFDEADS